MNNNIKIYICDDDKRIIDTVKERTRKILKKNYWIGDITIFDNGKDLIEKWCKNKADVVFLDIDMPKMTGFEIAEKLRNIKNDIIIVFITSHEDKVYQSWEFQPFWFVRKSHLNDLDMVITRLLTKITSERENDNPIITLNAENEIIEINLKSTVYIESYKHYIIIVDINKKEAQTRCKISEVEKQLKDNYFVRVQNGVVVNCRFISKVTSREVILISNDKIHIGRDRINNVREEFQKFIRSR